ncbi:baseplate assembly protein [Sediminimonas qiaohouensis]|uniref:baseplate assembly protein n=1 Tax=Sediminimonas qiaohouensis TaxID=552061 RepID=UPI00041D4495|nr:baseplate J/gp47 family protein [Sediminimonas qiaohouensis]
MTAFTTVDLSELPSPDVVQQLDYEAELAAMKAMVKAKAPELTEVLDLESEPVVKLLEIAAYYVLLVRGEINDGARAVMLAYAAGADLDQIAANYDVARLVIDPGDPEATPPVPPVMESDTDLRQRVQLSPEGYTVAGSRGAYVFHALSADGDVKDAQAISPSAGNVTVYVLSRQGNGSASVDLVDAVHAALDADAIRPMTDNVTVQSASVTDYTVDAALTVYPGPDAQLIRQTAEDSATAYVEAQHRLGYDVTLSGLYAALHQSGVQNVSITSPAADIVVATGEAAFCTGVTVTVADTDV